MQVILLEKVRNLGALGETVHVKPGYGRNFLIPQGKAVFATAENKTLFEKRRAELEKKAEAALVEAQKRATKLNDVTVTIPAQASDEGKLYGSVGIVEIRDALQGMSLEVCKREINLPDGVFHSVGIFDVEVQLHSDVMATIKVEIVAAK